MNLKLLTSIIIFSFAPSLYAAPPKNDMLEHEISRARQVCERSQPRAVCVELERARYQELWEQRAREVVERERDDQSDSRRNHRGREHQRDRDDRNYRDRDRNDERNDRRRDRDERQDRDDRGDNRDRDEEARTHYCRHHPEICEAQRREQEERAARQAWCERKFSRRQCLEMEQHEPSSRLPNRRDRDDRTRDIDRRDHRESPRVIQPREIPHDRPYRRPAQD